MASPLAILVDGSQKRLALNGDSISYLVSGRDWDPTNFVDTWVDPITNTAMLRPGPQYPDWSTSVAGIFAKLPMSAFTLTDSGNWFVTGADDAGLTPPAGCFYSYRGPSGNVAGLQGVGPTLGINQPMVIEVFMGSSTNAPYGVLDFGISSTHDSTAGVAFRLYGNGSMDVYVDGYLAGNYSLGGTSQDYFNLANIQARQALAGATPLAPKLQYITIMMIPFRDREILMVSSTGGGFSHVVQTLAESVAGQTITPAAPFWFYAQPNIIPTIRISYLQYSSSGYICGYQSGWRATPPMGSPTIWLYQALSQAGAGLVTPSIIAPATNPYSLAYPIQGKVAMVAGAAPNWTPFVYGMRAFYPPVSATTGSPMGGAIDALDFAMSLTFDVSDTIGGSKVEIEFAEPGAMVTAGIVNPTGMCNRVVQIYDAVGMIVNGVQAQGPDFTDATGTTDEGADLNRSVKWSIRDLWKILENFKFSDPIPLDGLSALQIFVMAINMAGIPGTGIGSDGPFYVSATASGFGVPESVSSGGDWNMSVEPGQSAAELITRIHEKYCANWFLGYRPNRVTPADPPLLSIIDPADTTAHYSLPSSAVITLYRSQADAISIGGYTAADAYKYVYRTLDSHILEPEANDVWVVGADPRSNKPIVCHRADAASQDPTTAPASRPSNWLGELRKYGFEDPTITTLAEGTSCLDLMYDRVTPARQIIEIECEYQDGQWRGDLFLLNSCTINDEDVDGPVRIKTFHGVMDHVSDPSTSPMTVWRPCRYIVEVGPIVAPLGVAGTRAKVISQGWSMFKALSKNLIKEDFKLVGRRPSLNIQDV